MTPIDWAQLLLGVLIVDLLICAAICCFVHACELGHKSHPINETNEENQ